MNLGLKGIVDAVNNLLRVRRDKVDKSKSKHDLGEARRVRAHGAPEAKLRGRGTHPHHRDFHFTGEQLERKRP